MALMMRFAVFNCPYCGEKFNDSEIGEIHFTKECPNCKKELMINAHEALTRTLTAGFIALISIGIYAWIIYEVMKFIGLSNEKIESLPAYVEVLLVMFGTAGAIGPASIAVKIYKKIILNRAHREYIINGGK